uniref:Uncharacterized protein n=1 Tax=Arundo donax TaxID=35708 RepID=A0A0A9HKD5_ARUDO
MLVVFPFCDMLLQSLCFHFVAMIRHISVKAMSKNFTGNRISSKICSIPMLL